MEFKNLESLQDLHFLSVNDRNKSILLNIENSGLNFKLEDMYNEFSTIFFRLGYLIWNLKGANLLKPVNYYGYNLLELSDDGDTLRGAYGVRMKYWVGVDALQEAIKINQSIDDEEDFVKPVGVDQIQRVYYDLENGQIVSRINIFDPAIDFEDSNWIPDLNSVFFKNCGNKLEMIMNYIYCAYDELLFNDIFLFEYIKNMLAGLIKSKLINTQLNLYTFDYKYKDNISLTTINYLDNDYYEYYEEEKFNNDIKILIYFETNLRMQINYDTMSNEMVNITQLTELLINKLLKKLNYKVNKNIGYGLLYHAIIKYSDNAQKYCEVLDKCLENMTENFKEICANENL